MSLLHYCDERNYPHPEKPEGADEGILKGMYLLKNTKIKEKLKFNF